ncbi:MAG TPA: hypothetical protein VK879_05570 [Candidatus Sulfomarinibacteraceae bacterium]|nr:hypothetical protein [Candidatus Sulfomarinibacteraceae bacterium]
MAELTVIAPLLPGKVETCRRFCQAMNGRRRSEYEASRAALRILHESAWLLCTSGGNLAVVTIEAANLSMALQELASSDRPFDRWFRRHVLEICGLDLTCLQAMQKRELIFDWSTMES